MKQLTFHSFDEYAAAVQHADIHVTLVSRQQTDWALDYLPIGDISVQWGQDAGPNVVEGSGLAGGVTLFIPHRNANSIAGNGCRMEDGSVMLLMPGEEFCIAATNSNRWSSIFIPFGHLAVRGVPKHEMEMKSRVLLPTAAGKRFRVLIEKLGIASRDIPDTDLLWSAVTAARTKIIESAAAVLGFRNNNATAPGRHGLPRRQIARAALQKLEEHASEHLSVGTLSTMIGISERTLRTAFVEYFGVGPTRYLRVRTLHQARTLLKAADPYRKSVTEIVFGLGIWELGRFSQDYKMLFDELPSETLRNG